MEAYARTKINQQLQNLNWFLSGSNKNVFQEEARTKDERIKLGRLRPDYVLYASDPKISEPLGIIETKSAKTNGLDGAIEQGEDYARKLNASFVFATDGIFYKTQHLNDGCPLVFNGEELNGLIEEKIALNFRTTYDVDLRPKEVKISQDRLIGIFSDINKILRKHGLLAGYERFSEFATVLFLKLFSEKEALLESPRISSVFTWEYLSKLNSDELLPYVQKNIFPEIAKLYKDDDIFAENLRIKDSAIFKQIYDKLNPLQLSYINEDIKGSAFEYFLANSPSADKDLGEYFTPRHIVKTMVSIVDPQIGEKIYDPFCGTGGMLIESYKHIWRSMKQTKKNIDTLQHKTVYGRDITSNSRIAKMNMILAGDGHNGIKQCDSLAQENLKNIEGKFDVVITNFPFSQNTDHNNLYDIPSNNGDSICLQHCINALKSGGRMAIVVPEGILFRDDLKKTREYLFQKCHIENVISLPQGIFLPYATAKTNILYCIKKASKNKTWFYEVKNDGFSLDAYRRKSEGRSDLDKFLSFRNVLDNDKEDFGFVGVEPKEIKDNNYNLLVNQYHSKIIDSGHSKIKIGDISELIRGVTFSKNEYINHSKEEYIGIVTTRSAQTEGIVYKHLRFVKTDKVIDNKILQKGDILMSISNSLNLVGRTTFVDKLESELSFGAFLICIRANSKNILPKYLYYCLNSKYSREYYLKEARTTTNISNLNSTIVQNLQIPLPSLKVQKKIILQIEKEEKSIKENQSHIEMSKNKIQTKIDNFWNVKRGKLSDKELVEKYENGGIDLKKTLKRAIKKP